MGAAPRHPPEAEIGAVELGLADRVGTLDDAIELAAEAAGTTLRTRCYDVQRSLRSRLTRGLAAELADQVSERLLALRASEPRF